MKIFELLLDVLLVLVMLSVTIYSPPRIDIKRGVASVALLLFGGIVNPLVIGKYIGVEIVEVVNVIITVCIVYILTDLKKKEFAVFYVVSLIIVNVVESLVAVIIQPVTDSFVPKKIVTLVIIGVFSFLVVGVFKKKIDFEIIPKKLLIAIGVLFGTVSILFVGISVFFQNVNIDSEFASYFSVFAVLACIAVFGIAFESIMLEVSKMNLERENNLLQNYTEQQQKYYELLLQKEEDTRRYRHDMLNHMICLSELLDNGSTEEAKGYISNITDNLNASKKNLYHTGNRIADVILTNIFQDKSAGTEISVVGQLSPEMKISDYDFCIVISNILKNAVEAVNRQSDDSHKFIKVKFSLGKRYLRIEEWNSVALEQIKNAQKLETSKQDKRRHGLGTKNIKLIVEKYQGTFETEVEDNVFHLRVDLDLKNKNN